ncbi:MAG TPA: extracellular solute-binding protein [Pseudomonadales bacterium]|nr:extracellular solute-binding protein [Pseudomonadales bacterium]
MTSRRQVLKAGAAAIGSLSFPYIATAYNRRPTLRVLGTHVTLQETLRLEAERALDINLEFYPGGSAEVLLKAATNPNSFDIYEQWSNSLRVLWDANSIKGVDITKIYQWNNINSLTKTGKISEQAKYGYGDAPYKLLYVQADGTLGPQATEQISFLPYVHNTDSFGYNTRYIPEGKAYETESWGWLFDETYRGKVAIVNEPTIGLFDLALAAQARNLIEFKDIGNMSRAELDNLFSIVDRLQRKRHFRGVWSSVPRSVELMANNEVVIQSMFSPGVATLRGMGVPCRYAAPKEGYRAWHGVMCLSRTVDSEREELAYKFMNWWLSGWPGAYIARQGYYISNPQISKPFMSQAEWDFWYEGKPAAEQLLGTDGNVAVHEGEERSGGSYIKRFENIAVWNTVMPNYEYSLTKWNEFLFS